MDGLATHMSQEPSGLERMESLPVMLILEHLVGEVVEDTPKPL